MSTPTSNETTYDDLDESEQAFRRAKWAERIDDAVANLDLAAEFTRAGRSWVEADERGNPVKRNGTSE